MRGIYGTTFRCDKPVLKTKLDKIKIMKTAVLVDFQTNKGLREFCQSLESVLGSEIQVCECVNNHPRTNRIKKTMRYLRYFVFPLKFLLSYRKYDVVIGWQQFYGLNLAFWLRLLHIEKKGKLIVMTFIYKPKKGWLGKVYHSYMKYVIDSGYIDKCIVFSKAEIPFYDSIFQTKGKMFEYVPLGIETGCEILDCTPKDEKYIFSTGRSNRDYDFLYASIYDTEFVLQIACDNYTKPPRSNIEILANCFGTDMHRRMATSYCVVVPLKQSHVSAGQLVVLQAMQLGKPVIVTKTPGIEDYIIDGYNGFLIDNTKEQLLRVLRKLYMNKDLYDAISSNAYRTYLNQHTIKQMGLYIGNVAAGVVNRCK